MATAHITFVGIFERVKANVIDLNSLNLVSGNGISKLHTRIYVAYLNTTTPGYKYTPEYILHTTIFISPYCGIWPEILACVV